MAITVLLGVASRCPFRLLAHYFRIHERQVPGNVVAASAYQ
jgi:hypothetical protein